MTFFSLFDIKAVVMSNSGVDCSYGGISGQESY